MRLRILNIPTCWHWWRRSRTRASVVYFVPKQFKQQWQWCEVINFPFTRTTINFSVKTSCVTIGRLRSYTFNDDSMLILDHSQAFGTCVSIWANLLYNWEARNAEIRFCKKLVPRSCQQLDWNIRRWSHISLIVFHSKHIYQASIRSRIREETRE